MMAAVTTAGERGLTLAVRGGGHNAGGLGVWDDALVVDLSEMRAVHVDPAERVVRVEGGATWGDVDHATHPFGLAVPSGFISTTGVGGLTLGGGIGYLSRQFGLTIDSLLAADVVLADGTMVTADAERHPDLFWALRGGGGNFGVVTAFTFRAHPVRDVVGGPMFFDVDRAAEVMRAWDRFLDDAPDSLDGWFGFVAVPPAPDFPTELHGRTVAAIIWCYNGPAEDAEGSWRRCGPSGRCSTASARCRGPHSSPSSTRCSRPGCSGTGRRTSSTSSPTRRSPSMSSTASRLPTPQSTMHLYPVSGAAQRVDGTETAYAHRQARYAQVIVGVDPDPARLDEMTAWARSYHDALHPHSAGGGYVNMMMDDEGPDRVRASYGDNFSRLADVKRRYDPENAFHVNQNISPDPV